MRRSRVHCYSIFPFDCVHRLSPGSRDTLSDNTSHVRVRKRSSERSSEAVLVAFHLVTGL